MIPSIAWNDYYSVGEPSLDAEHKQIIFCINDLFAALQEGAPAQAVRPVLDCLVQYTLTHFQHEEEVMQAYDFPGLAEHKKLHDQMREKTRTLHERAEAITGQDLLFFLKQWWLEHIQGEDKKYAPYLKVSHSRR
ncbi:MAG: hemerythrin family protein [Pirellulales bacterium]|nr:hemerythrin family protein [Pirellulales bacterium]